ncbi:plasmid segregation protein ParM [Undibacterium sp. GrIS 1.8]|uniref:PRTRC system protein D n=1 Tax=unclassified Undibacterium TaxID=2630295 RepID=UPI00339086E3
MYFPVFACDIGFGQTKVAARLPGPENKLFYDSFPSLSPRHVTSNLSSHLPNAVANRTYIVRVDDVEFAVGPDVKFAVGGTTGNGRTLTDDFPTSVNYKALFLGALAHVDATEVDLLVLGLPVHTMKLYKDHLLKHFVGEFQVRGKSVVVHKVIILPQPVGALLHYGSTIEEGLSQDENRLIVDCGYVTTDWVLSHGYRMIESRSSGTPTGVSAILNSMADLISKDEGKPFDQIERIDDALISGKPMRFFKNMIQPDKLRSYLDNSSFITDDCAKKIRSSVGDGGDLSSILMVGGGSHYFAPSIAKSFQDVEIIQLDNSPFCNVNGFLLFGEHQHKRLKAA